MDERNIARAFMSLLYLGLLFGGGGWVYQSIQHFEGVVVVGEGKSERLALRPVGGGNPFGASYRNLPFDVLPLATPHTVRRVLDPLAHYDASELPAMLHLAKIEAREAGAADERLLMEVGGEETHFPVEAGASLQLGGYSGEIIAVQPWVGLIARPQGTPLALVRLKDAETASGWSEKLFIQPKSWRYYKNYAVYFDWFPGKQQAENALPNKRPGIERARWGIEDGGRIHWMNSFAQGTGVERDNGDEVTLLGAKFDDGVPAILVQVLRPNNTADRIRVLPGEARNGVHFEYPAAREHIVFVHAWRDSAAEVRIFSQTQDGGGTLLAPEQENAEAGVRVVQALQRAIPVDDSGDPVYELRIRLNGKEYALREGLRIPLEDASDAVQYLRIPPPTEAHYHLNASSATDAGQQRFVLADGAMHQLGDWRVRLHPEIKPAPGTVVLLAERTLGGTAKKIGLALFMLGALGWVLVRFLKPPAVPHNPEIEDRLDAMLAEAETQAPEEEI